ncbi:MAG TPA: 1-acyl-sn-glycerol-3-phosphate acyltransferase [Kofleriaceae bacterium]|mgnify:CR=1 FL=1|nr:1-acyl-sn-glycerol-3-phosphate acyltransferase [Kofleriaceae bacterium]
MSATSALRRPVVALFRTIMHVYFRSVQRVGQVPAATVGGRVFVANHHNALVDPMLILTDAPCVISPVAKSTLWRIPGFRWLLDIASAVPIVRRQDVPEKQADSNAAAFDRIAAHLAGGGNILIFPEGKSHADPTIAPLRSGAARMLMAAHALKPMAPLSFQAVALEFDAADTFRSRTALLWGSPRGLDDVIASHDALEAQVDAITELMQTDLRSLVIESASREDRLLVGRVAQMLSNDRAATSDASLGDELATARAVASVGAQLQQLAPARIDEVRTTVQTYFGHLAQAELRDIDVAAPLRRRPLSELLRLATTAPLALVGLLLYALPYPLPRIVAQRADDADMVSTLKLGVALVLYPVWATLLVVATMLLLPWPASIGVSILALVAPFVTVWWLDRWQSRPGRFATRSSETRTSLAEARRAAMAAIGRAQAVAVT